MALAALMPLLAVSLVPGAPLQGQLARPVVQPAASPLMQFGGMFGGGGNKGGGGGGQVSARDADFARRQEKLASRKQAAVPKGEVEVTFPQKGNKVVKAKQGEPIGAVCKRAGVRVKFDCKNGRCGTCQVRLNGRSALKVCQGGTVPGGATKKLTITLDNP